MTNSRLFGRVPADGALLLGAINNHGPTLVAGKIRSPAHKILNLPDGSYTVAVWLPQATQL